MTSTSIDTFHSSQPTIHTSDVFNFISTKQDDTDDEWEGEIDRSENVTRNIFEVLNDENL